MERDFKGIWIPKEIWLDENLTIQEKVFFVEIDSLDNEEGCYATNNYFADFFGISKTRVSRVINSLVDKGYITSTIEYKEGTKQILKRVLNISYIPYTTKVQYPIQQKFKDNNTINKPINNTLITSTKLTGKKKRTVKKKPKTNSETFPQLEELRRYIPTFDREASVFTKNPVRETHLQECQDIVDKYGLEKVKEIMLKYYKNTNSSYPVRLDIFLTKYLEAWSKGKRTTTKVKSGGMWYD